MLSSQAVINRLIGYTSTISAFGLIVVYLLYRKVRNLLIWAIILGLIGYICLSRYGIELFRMF